MSPSSPAAANVSASNSDYPKGDAHNPLSDREVEEKFTALADGVLTRPRRKRVIDAIWNLEKAGSITPLMEMLKAEKA